VLLGFICCCMQLKFVLFATVLSNLYGRSQGCLVPFGQRATPPARVSMLTEAVAVSPVIGSVLSQNTVLPVASAKYACWTVL